MIDKIQMYIRSQNKIFIYINDEILFFEDQEIPLVLEHLKEEFELNKNKINVELILHFSYFLIDEKINTKINGITKKWYLNYNENKYLEIFLEKSKINNWKKILKKYKFDITNIKIDFDTIFNFYKKENCEILQFGEIESVNMKIENEKIEEFEKIDLKMEDIDESYDFSGVKTIFEEDDDIMSIFLGGQMYENPNFLKNEHTFSVDYINNIKIKDIFIFGILILSYFIFNNFIPVEKVKKENQKIKMSTKELEKRYLKEKSEEIPSYSKELNLLNEIDNSLKRKEFYSMIKFLVDSSEIGIDYTKINYENKKWIIQGEILDFNNFEKFENKVIKKYKKNELGYLKDNDIATLFEYIILD